MTQAMSKNTSLLIEPIDTEGEERSLSSKLIRNGDSIDINPLDATFRDSGRAPLHSWFPYLEGYAPRFVEGVRNEFLPDARKIIDPFAGSGTTPIVLGQNGVECAYSEANPAMAFIIKSKLKILSLKINQRKRLSDKIFTLADRIGSQVESSPPDTELLDSYTSTFGKSSFFEESTLNNILRLRTFNDSCVIEDETLGMCLTLAIMASLIPSSRLKRAGDLRFRTPKELLKGIPCVLDSVKERLIAQASDVNTAVELQAETSFACATAGDLYNSIGGGWDGVITSPPYLNGTNYIRNARLELWYCRLVKSQSDIRKLRDGVITSGINDVNVHTDWRPVTDGVKRVVVELEEKAYDQRISKMVGGYFRDMRAVLTNLANCLNSRGRLCIDIGDSIYAGVHVPTDDLLVEVAESLGLKTLERVHLRKRTSNGGQPVRQQLLIFEKRET